LRYEVVETNVPAGYSSASVGSAGQIAAGTSSTAAFTNTYSNPYASSPASAIVQASKVLEGADLNDGQFSFVLEGEGNTYTASNSLDGMVSFDLSYDAAGTYQYTLKETAGDSDDIIYDDTVYDVTVTVTESGSRLVSTVSYSLNGKSVSAPVFTNTMKPGSLSISKETADAPDAMKDEEFSFVLHLADSEGKALSGKYSVADSDLELSDGDTFTLKAGASLVLENIPAGTQYTVEETGLENSGWTLSKTENTTGTIVSNTVSAAKFTNTFAPKSASLAFTASKKLMDEDESMTLEKGQFTFQLLDEKGNVLSTAANDKEGNIVFDEIVYEGADVGQTYTYQIKEVNDSQKFITYDQSAYTRTVTVSEKDGKVTYALDDESDIVFENAYSYSASGYVILKGRKTLEDADLTDGQFNFKVFENGEEVAAGSNMADGTIVFDSITYTLEDAGVHTYTIKEVKNPLDIFTVYDNSECTVQVTVSNNGDGTLKAVVSGEEISFTNLHRELTMPASGGFGIGLGIFGGAVLMAGAVCLTLKKKS
jgi:pilin isopeptide linkage protein